MLTGGRRVLAVVSSRLDEVDVGRFSLELSSSEKLEEEEVDSTLPDDLDEMELAK